MWVAAEAVFAHCQKGTSEIGRPLTVDGTVGASAGVVAFPTSRGWVLQLPKGSAWVAASQSVSKRINPKESTSRGLGRSASR